MINGGMLGYSTSYNNTKIKTGSESCNFEFGNKYWFAIMITDGTQKSWSTVKSLDLDYKVTNLRMDYVTGTKCKIIWDYPEFSGTFNVHIYTNTPGGNRQSVGYLSQVTSSGQNYYLIEEGLTRNTEYQIEVKLTYYNTESFSPPITIKTLDIQKLANFAVTKSELYAYNAAGLTFRANAENYIIVIEGKPVRDNDFGYVFPDDEGDAAVAAQLEGLVWNGSVANWDLWFHGSSLPYTSDELVGYCKYNNGNLESSGRFNYNQPYDFKITAYNYSNGSFTPVSTDCIIYTPRQ